MKSNFMGYAMGNYILYIIIFAVVWVYNGKEIIHAARDRVASEIYIHTGLGLFFSLIIIERAFGKSGLWMHFGIQLLRIFGFMLFVPSALFVVASYCELKKKGKPVSDISTTTSFVQSGVYRIIRQPMTLGMTIWSIALIMVFQSVPALIIGMISLFCFRLSAAKEAEYNIIKFGDDYQSYMEKVPMWNIFRWLRRQ